MSQEPKDIVKEAYENIADWYLDYAENDVSPRQRYAKKVLEASPSSPRLLELGCGPGVREFGSHGHRLYHITRTTLLPLI